MHSETPRRIASEVDVVSIISDSTLTLDGLILAAGFESRSFQLLEKGNFKSGTQCILIRFVNNVPGNSEVFDRYKELAENKFGNDNLHIVNLSQSRPGQFEVDLFELLLKISRDVRYFGVDISGQPAHAICMTLKALREARKLEQQLIYYTAALEYVPTKAEYDAIPTKLEEIELIPRSMALEMSENWSPDSFSGYRSQNARTCLAIFAGYEAHRSTGVVDAVNPSILLLMYGSPGDGNLSWRLKLSKRLHKKFEKGRRTATEVTSTLHLNQSLDLLEQYYNFVIDDYDLVIAPIGSKMHSVAAFLFWERYEEIKLTFPLPIGYDPESRPRGSGKTYQVKLEAKQILAVSEIDGSLRDA